MIHTRKEDLNEPPLEQKIAMAVIVFFGSGFAGLMLVLIVEAYLDWVGR